MTRLFQQSWNFSLQEIKRRQEHPGLTWWCRWGGCCLLPAMTQRGHLARSANKVREEGHVHAPSRNQLLRLIWNVSRARWGVRVREQFGYKSPLICGLERSFQNGTPSGPSDVPIECCSSITFQGHKTHWNKQSPFPLKVLLQAAILIWKKYIYFWKPGRR